MDTARRPILGLFVSKVSKGRPAGSGARAVQFAMLGTAPDKQKDGRCANRVRLSVAADRHTNSICGFIEGVVAEENADRPGITTSVGGAS
jgi:hypothetical protein